MQSAARYALIGTEGGHLTIESTRQDIVPIQMLRGIAATMVVLVHIALQLSRLGFGSYNADWLSSGVDIFFVISGFIMWVSVERRGGMTPGEFMRHRIIRIVPLYWAVSAGVLLICLVAPHLLRTTTLDPSHAIASFLFVPARHPTVTSQFWPLLIPGWTLNYEMMFYVLFATAIAGSGGSARTRFAIIAALIFGTVFLAMALKSRIDVLSFYANPIIFEFLAGVLVGIVYLRGWFGRSRLWLFALAGAFFLLWYGDAALPAPGSRLVGATMVVAGALFTPAMPIPGLKAVGDASYSLYLTHVVTLAAIARFWRVRGLEGPMGEVAFALVGLIASVTAAVLCYHLLERPMTVGLKRLWRPSPKHLPAA